MGLPVTMDEIGLTDEDLPAVAERASVTKEWTCVPYEMCIRDRPLVFTEKVNIIPVSENFCSSELSGSKTIWRFKL